MCRSPVCSVSHLPALYQGLGWHENIPYSTRYLGARQAIKSPSWILWTEEVRWDESYPTFYGLIWKDFSKIPLNIPTWRPEGALRVTNQLRMCLVSTALLSTVLSPRRRLWKPGWQKEPTLRAAQRGGVLAQPRALRFLSVHSIQTPGWRSWCYVACTRCLALSMDCRRTLASLTGLLNPRWDSFCWRFCGSLLWHMKMGCLVPGIWLRLQWEFVGLHIPWSELGSKCTTVHTGFRTEFPYNYVTGLLEKVIWNQLSNLSPVAFGAVWHAMFQRWTSPK